VRRPRRILLDAATLLSFVLFAATAVCWIIGLVREPNATVWRLHSRPGRTFFARIGRQHLIFSEQQIVSSGMPPGYVLDTSKFREYTVWGPDFPRGAGTDLLPEHWALNPVGAWFRKFKFGHGGVVVQGPNGSVAWRTNGFYGAVEIPWWSLLVLFSVVPASRWVARRRRVAKVRRGLCTECGYDLRATPGRCPECGAVPL
jgi:hypothetical protein